MKLAAIGIVSGVLLSSLLIMPVQTAQAADLTYWSTACPPPYNATYWTVYPRYSTAHLSTDAVKVMNDDSYLDLYVSSTGISKWVLTNDFTDNGSWIDPGNSTFSQPTGDMPVADAIITSVYVVAAFTVYHPQMKFSFSVNNESSWAYSTVLAESTTSYATWGNVLWNVTSLATWTVNLLNSSSVSVRLQAWPTAGTHYYLDYLGLVIGWWAELEGGGSGWDPADDEGTDETPSSIDYSFIYSAEGMVSIMGLIGLIGMIGIPAAGVYIARNSHDSRINILVKMIALWAFCFSLFMYMVTS